MIKFRDTYIDESKIEAVQFQEDHHYNGHAMHLIIKTANNTLKFPDINWKEKAEIKEKLKLN